MNRFRLLEAVPKQEFEHYTGLSQSAVKNQIDFAIQTELYRRNTGFFGRSPNTGNCFERAVSAFFSMNKIFSSSRINFLHLFI